jgi:oligopeptide transport system substrate-binding protein
MHPNWSLQVGDAYICNGPFVIESASPSEGFVLKQNLHYWDSTAVQLDRVSIYRATDKRALEMYINGEIDWLGRPSRPWEPFFSERLKRPAEKLPYMRGCWCACNVQQFPLQSTKIRLALAYAVDRKAFIHPSVDRLPAFTPLPRIHSQYHHAFTEEEREQAPKLFKEGLEELGIRRGQWPVLTLIHVSNDVRRDIASTLVKQWKEVLGITVRLEAHDYRSAFAKMTTGDYQLGLTMWRTWVDDPLYTFNSFKHRVEAMNFSKWENAKYQQLLNSCTQETCLERRNRLLSTAESILVGEMPVIPVVYEAELFHRGEHVKGEFFSKIGNVDFTYVSINKGGTDGNKN